MTFEDKLLLVLQTIGIPLLLAVVLAAAGRSARRVVRIFALAALVLLIAGLALRQRLVVGSLSDGEQRILGLTLVVWWQLLYLAGGAAFYVAALAAALDTARARRWGWFAGLVVAALLANVAAVALATPLRVLNFTTSLFQLVLRGGQDFYVHFYLAVSIVLVATTLAPLLYSFAARDQIAAPQYVVTSEPPVGPNDVTQP
jgi:hypothetical protein